ncbi:MAG: MBL fold metallo-hydrolase, partial [Chloroflexi bacterium]|nr:MBL fold metallo-hydrolase [Chloroflexota bacterium]
MKVKWLGHAAFLITSASGKRIITDPYTNNPNLNYQPIRESANVVTVSHEHGDHNNVASVSGNPQVINTAGTHKVGDIEFRGIPTYHDATKGSQRGA